MATIDEIRKNRLEKSKAIEKAGILLYPAETKRTHKISEAIEDFKKLSRTKKEIILNGRVRSQRVHGKVTFLNIEDGTGKTQTLLRENGVGAVAYKFFFR